MKVVFGVTLYGVDLDRPAADDSIRRYLRLPGAAAELALVRSGIDQPCNGTLLFSVG
jgi:hypothetical protein